MAKSICTTISITAAAVVGPGDVDFYRENWMEIVLLASRTAKGNWLLRTFRVEGNAQKKALDGNSLWK